MKSPSRTFVIVAALIVAALLSAFPLYRMSVVRAAGTITGIAFQDYNGDGLLNATSTPAQPILDRGIGGITVTGYDAAGVAQGSAVSCNGSTWKNGAASSACSTAQIGQYQMTVAGTGPYRVEFTWDNTSHYLDVARTQFNPLYGLQPSARNVDSVGSSGANNASSTVHFVPDGSTSNVNLAVYFPGDYCQPNPDLAGNRVIVGDPLAAGSNTAAEDTLLKFPYNASGQALAGGTAYSSCATYSQLGSTWGLSYQRSSKRIFVASVLKRHSGLGPLGLSGIYIGNPNVAGSGVGWYSGLNVGTVPSNVARGLPADGAQPSYDDAIFGLIGKVGLGDIDLSEDDTTLYVTNLFDRKLYAINIAAVDANTPGYTPASYTIPDPGCTNGVSRPWAIKAYRGFVFSGVICTGELGGTAADLSAHVYALDPSTGTWSASVLDVPLNYPKGCTFLNNECGWQPWTDQWTTGGLPNFDPLAGFGLAFRTMPILADLEFDDDGYMILGFMDRAGHMLGYRNNTPVTSSALLETGIASGDILIAAPPTNPGGKFTLEADGVVGNRTTAGTGTTNVGPGGPNSSQGPHNPANAGTGGEFYWADTFGTHSETSSGGMAFLPGSGEVTLASMDPFSIDAGGVVWYSQQDGSRKRGYEIYDNSLAGFASGKANGIGDMELLCNAAPIEIGNRVWIDANRDGVQGPDEVPVPGVTVHLYDNAGTLIGTAVTNVNGEWYFSSASGTSTPNVIFGTNILPNQNYTIRLDNPADYAPGGPLEGYSLTLPNASGTSNNGVNDNRDSDATQASPNQPIGAGNFPTINYTSGGAGSNNHSLDIGFFTPYSLGNRVWFDTNNNGLIDTGEQPVNGVVVQLLDGSGNPIDADATTPGIQPLTSTTANGGYYRFDNLTPGNYMVQVLASNFAPGGPLASYWSSGPDETNPNANGDRNDNGLGTVPDAVNGIRSGVVTLGPGLQPLSETDLVPGVNPQGNVDSRANMTVDFGFLLNPTAITLTSFTAQTVANGTLVRWTTLAEVNTYGFRLLRSATRQRSDAVEVTSQLISANGRGQLGASYLWLDRSAQTGVTYTYWLVEVETTGAINEYGPTGSTPQAAAEYRMILPMVSR